MKSSISGLKALAFCIGALGLQIGGLGSSYALLTQVGLVLGLGQCYKSKAKPGY